MRPEPKAKLTPRELECLTWSGEGKTAGEIACILGITKRTVDLHISNAVEKLDASNKTHAVVRHILNNVSATGFNGTSFERIAVGYRGDNDDDDANSFEIVKRRNAPLRDIADEDIALREALRRWQNERDGGLLPVELLSLDAVSDARELVGTHHVIDVVDYNKYVARFSPAVMNRMSPLMKNPLDFCSMTARALRSSILEDFSGVAFSGVPEYHHVVARVYGTDFSYSRLTLPFTQDGRKVSSLLVCINKRLHTDWKVTEG